MKRIFVILLIAALLCACTAATGPVVETDTRAEQTAVPIEEDTIGKVETETQTAEPQPTEAPEKPTEATEKPTEAPETSQTLAQHIVGAWESEGFLEGMAPYSAMDLLDLYGIDLSACKSGAGYADAVGYVKEAVVVEADEATATEIETLLQNHIEQVKETFRSYDADAYAIAENAVLERKGGVVLMIVSPDAEAMKALFETLLP